MSSKGVKRKSLSTSVAVGTPDFVVPRVRVRHGGYVVPSVRARPHGTERKLLGITAVSDLSVPFPDVIDVSDEEPVGPHPRSRKRAASGDKSLSPPPGVLVNPDSGRVAPSKCVTFAESAVSRSPVVSTRPGSRRSRRRRSNSSIVDGRERASRVKNNNKDEEVWLARG